MGKLSFLIGFGAGYIVGARAGERRYEEIKSVAGQAWNHPAVQQQVTKATEVAKEKGPEIAAAAGSAAIKGVGNAAKSAAAAGLHAATGSHHQDAPVVQSGLAAVDDPEHPTRVGYVEPPQEASSDPDQDTGVTGLS